ncbi:MAG TPA: hypothetical protein VGC39_11665 [Candidatus Methylacidiphilales bacterium]
MSYLRSLLVLTLSCCAANAYSQQPAADASSTFAVPSEPLVHPAPAFSQWTITFSYPDDAKAISGSDPSAAAKLVPQNTNAALRPRTIITTKTGEIIHEETLTVGGNKTEDWQVHGNYYIKYPGKDFWSAYETSGTSAGGTSVVMGLPVSGFRGLDWITKETYAGEIKAGMGGTLVFVPGGRNTVNAGDPSKQKELESLAKIALVDAETRLPVMVRAEGETRVFKFTESPPASVQTLPEDLASEIKEGDEIRAKRTAAPQREY